MEKAKISAAAMRQHGAQHLAGLGDMHQAGGDQHGVLAVGGRCAPPSAAPSRRAAGGLSVRTQPPVVAAVLAHGRGRCVRRSCSLLAESVGRRCGAGCSRRGSPPCKIVPQGGIGDIHTEAAHANRWRTAGWPAGQKTGVSDSRAEPKAQEESVSPSAMALSSSADDAFGLRRSAAFQCAWCTAAPAAGWTETTPVPAGTDRYKHKNHISCPRMPTVRRFCSGCRMNRYTSCYQRAASGSNL